MARVGTVTGLISVGEAGVADVVQAISLETPTVVGQNKGVRVLTAGGTTSFTFAALGVINAIMVWAKFTDILTGVAQSVTITKVNGNAVTFPSITEILLSDDDTAAGWTSLVMTAVAGNDTKMEFIIAGV